MNIIFICHGNICRSPVGAILLNKMLKEKGIRQEELAMALEVSRQTIGSLENGRYNPSIQLAFKISKYFGLKIEDVFIYEEE